MTVAKKTTIKKTTTSKEKWFTAFIERQSETYLKLDDNEVYGPYQTKDEAVSDMCKDQDFGDYVNGHIQVLVFKDAEIITVTEKRIIEKKSVKI